MGRIDEALRRAGTPAASAAANRRDDPFSSPWRVGVNEPALDTVIEGSGVLDRTAAPATSPGWRQRLAPMEAAEPLLAEQFRRLVATLFQARRSAPLKVIMVTSAVPEEGKTLTAVNLALVLSESFRRQVLLIDADLRRPRISESVDSQLTDGLGAVLKASEPRKSPLIHLSETLTLLPAGRRDPDPLSGLTSPRMQALLNDASEAYEWVIVDTPPVGAAADASLLCAMADGTILVVKAGQTSYEAVNETIGIIGRERIVGVVLNGVEQSEVPAYGYYGRTAVDPKGA